MSIILGIETSCDETGLALIETRGKANELDDFEYRILGSLIHSQAELHNVYGGVYPSLAKREHGKNLVPLLHKLLVQSALITEQNTIEDDKKEDYKSAYIREHAKEAKLEHAATARHGNNQFTKVIESFKAEIATQNPDLFRSFLNAEFLKNVPSIDRIAVTEGPGLEPALWVGINFARLLSALWNIPVVPVNHMEGHILGSLIENEAQGNISDPSWQKLKRVGLPAVALLISGGHTELVKISSRLGDYEILGQTKDDAVGECFDKCARLIGLPYPGGPEISKLSELAFEKKVVSYFKLPRPMMNSGDLNFSFSGLKTAVLYSVRDYLKQNASLDKHFKLGLARELEEAVADTLDFKLRAAVEKTTAKSVIIGGGVAANRMLRLRFEAFAKEYGIPIFMPSKHVSGDNALMIAIAGALDASTDSRTLKAEGTKRLNSY